MPVRVICVTIAPSYDRGRTMVRWLRKSLLKRKVPTGCLRTTRLRRPIRTSGEVLLHPDRLRIADAYHCENMSRCANAASRELGEEARPTLAAKDYVSSRSKDRKLFRRVSEARIEPVGSVLRVICVTIAPSYDRGRTMVRWLRKSLLADQSEDQSHA